MQLTDADIRDFQAAWREAFQEDLPVEQARFQASRVLTLCELLCRPLPTASAEPCPPSDQ